MKPVNEHEYISRGRTAAEYEGYLREGNDEQRWVRLRRFIVDREGEEFVAWCPEPHDIRNIVGVGPTPEAAIKAFQKAVARW